MMRLRFPARAVPFLVVLALALSVIGAAAEQTFRDDLVAWPNSGWALNGLQKALLAQGKQAEANAVLAELDRSWAQADREVRTRHQGRQMTGPG